MCCCFLLESKCIKGGTGGGINGGSFGLSSIGFLPALKLLTAFGKDSLMVCIFFTRLF